MTHHCTIKANPISLFQSLLTNHELNSGLHQSSLHSGQLLPSLPPSASEVFLKNSQRPAGLQGPLVGRVNSRCPTPQPPVGTVVILSAYPSLRTDIQGCQLANRRIRRPYALRTLRDILVLKNIQCLSEMQAYQGVLYLTWQPCGLYRLLNFPCTLGCSPRCTLHLTALPTPAACWETH